MSDNYSVHHFQRTGGGNVTGGVTAPGGGSAGGAPASMSYFDYTINYMEPTNNIDYASLNETDPIIDVDIETRTIRMLAKKSFIEIVDNKELYNDTNIDTANMHNKTIATVHEGDTLFKDDVTIERTLRVMLETILEDKLTVFKESLFKDDVIMEKDLTVNGKISSDDFYYFNGGSSSAKFQAFTEAADARETIANGKLDAMLVRLTAAEQAIAALQ